MKDVCSGSYVQREGNFAYFVACGNFPSGGRLVPGLKFDGYKGGI